MEYSIPSRFKRAWNAFMNNRDPTGSHSNIGIGYSHRPDRPRFTRGNERSIITALYNRMALDVSALSIQHVQLDEEDRFVDVLKT
jgi:hypothetical protein